MNDCKGCEQASPLKPVEVVNWLDNLRAKPLPEPEPASQESRPHPNDQEPKYVWPDVPTAGDK